MFWYKFVDINKVFKFHALVQMKINLHQAKFAVASHSVSNHCVTGQDNQPDVILSSTHSFKVRTNRDKTTHKKIKPFYIDVKQAEVSK